MHDTHFDMKKLISVSNIISASNLTSVSDLASVTDHTLHSNTMAAASSEKSATLVLLEYLAEVDRRRLYATFAYSSLWEYVHKALGYSEGQASERVGAMRVMVKVPEVREQLEEMEIKLAQSVAQVVQELLLVFQALQSLMLEVEVEV